MKYSTIKENDITDGIGISVSVWTQGCPFRCKGCFNEETWSFEEGLEFTQKEVEKVLALIDKNQIKRNLSILGGEPLCNENVKGVLELVRKFKEHYPDRYVYLWSGFTLENFNALQLSVLEYVDVLVDGLFVLEEKNLSLKLRGSKNQRVIDIKETLKQEKIILFIE